MSFMEKPINPPLGISLIIIPFVKRRLLNDSGHAPFWIWIKKERWNAFMPLNAVRLTMYSLIN